jgi:hypothetical protein
MTRLARSLIALLFALLAAAPAAHAQRSYSQPELDQMLAPIALYPDVLLSQVLAAATRPAEVADAAAWSRAHPGLEGDQAVHAAAGRWDPSVTALVAFPQVLHSMDANRDWMHALGDAYRAQEPQVMASVQQLRLRAQAAGHLHSDEQIRVEQQGEVIVLEPASPEYVYAPYYDPYEVYGTWWWPAYRPVRWSPWTGYARHHRYGHRSGYWWGRPVGVSRSFFSRNFDWRDRRVRSGDGFQRWQGDGQRRRPADAVTAPTREAFTGSRDWQRGERRFDRQPQQLQQPATRFQAQPAVAAPAIPAPAQPRFQQPGVERDRTPRFERREAQQAQPRIERQATPSQPRVDRQERREARQERREERARSGAGRS